MELRLSEVLNEEDVNWDKLISKVSSIYDQTMVKWQLFHFGKNKVEDVVNRIFIKILCNHRDSQGDYYFTTSEFNQHQGIGRVP